ncbi:MAG: hypothetical protein AMXMBFR58_37600 [Phycisphaerae bacterium]|nr:hypothetical protein [Phycisphaerales bacterium]
MSKQKATDPRGATGDDPPRALVPNDHLRLLVELLQPAGPELARRWLAALLLVHKSDREAVVRAVEQQLSRLYPLDEHDRAPSQSAALEVKPPRKSGRLSA